MNFIYLLFLSELILFIISLLLSDGDIMAPSVIMCIMFIISTACTIFSIGNWGVQYGIDSYLILVAGLLIFTLTEFLFRHLFSLKERFKPETIRIEFKPITLHWAIMQLMIIFNIIVLVWFYSEIKRIVSGYGMDVNGTRLFSNYRQIITSISTTNEAKVELTGFLLNQFVKIIEASGYISVFILMNNLLAGTRKIKQLFMHCIVIICTLSLYFIQGERGAILQLFSAGLIDWYILWHRKNGWNNNNSFKMVKLGISVIALGIPVFYLSLHLIGRTTNKSILEYTCFYVGCGIHLFDLYVKSPSITPMVWGEESLIGVHRFLNAIGVPVTVRNPHLEMRTLNSYTQGNIYTFFRRPLHDFGFWGMVLFTIVVAAFFAWIYFGKIKYKNQKTTISWILVYSQLFYWIVCMPMDQLSQSIVSVYGFAKIFLVVSGYYVLKTSSDVLMKRL